jgi:hypothetical protein
LSHITPIQTGLKQGCTLSPILLYFALQYVIRKSDEHQKRLKVIGKFVLLIYSDAVSLSGKCINITNRKREAVPGMQKEINPKTRGMTI